MIAGHIPGVPDIGCEDNPEVGYWRRRAEKAEKEVVRLKDRLNFALVVGRAAARIADKRKEL